MPSAANTTFLSLGTHTKQSLLFPRQYHLRHAMTFARLVPPAWLLNDGVSRRYGGWKYCSSYPIRIKVQEHVRKSLVRAAVRSVFTD